jgi:hypothetical protein
MIPENGTGLANADAYVSVEFADEYFSARGNQTWAGLDNAAKEAAIIKATDYLEAMYFDKWQGERLKSDQALSFPRSPFGMPAKFKSAVCELAIRANAGELMSDIERLTTKEKVGSIEVEYTQNADPATKYAYVASLLKPFLKPSSAMVMRLERC